ncbi:hypothetical protein F4823DRAFT_608239 [Ustulina deusta]|nr:hypothetical protein F4823DRAFT_608239 [Ustulina deusta]
MPISQRRAQFIRHAYFDSSHSPPSPPCANTPRAPSSSQLSPSSDRSSIVLSSSAQCPKTSLSSAAADLPMPVCTAAQKSSVVSCGRMYCSVRLYLCYISRSMPPSSLRCPLPMERYILIPTLIRDNILAVKEVLHNRYTYRRRTEFHYRRHHPYREAHITKGQITPRPCAVKPNPNWTDSDSVYKAREIRISTTQEHCS